MDSKKKTEDEAIDGAKVAAQIISRMGAENKKRVLQAIAEREPKLSIRIQESMFQFNDLASITAKGIQRLLAEVKHEDVVLSMKRASNEVQETLLSNMSERKRELVSDDVKSMPPVRTSEVEEAQRRILEKVEELRTTGAIQTKDKKDVWA